ncbi:hypothetical protein T440DRAFT_428026 [Plenodomus tracheiphilus IPT5]|uniref:HIT-type domain-containing protein n=1 Tax=Plenodomus tracheiphilus IPT5 TaxID=1408161 RepID=A0A6A7B395_9PLEO|nr:hypothetical protein T440DRAFT_428026 [Plenodomus tracheiphilus IPT5]
MSETLCGICHTEPKKYKCPTCAIPYCSIACFKPHKLTHPAFDPIQPTRSTLSTPLPPPPVPTPRYLKKKADFSTLATNPKFQNLLKVYPTLLTTLQRVYAKTIEPDPEDEARPFRQSFRGRGSRGRGRGGRWGGHNDRPAKWTQKKGDADAMGLLKGIRQGKGRDQEKEGMAEFVQLVEEMFGNGERMDEGE